MDIRQRVVPSNACRDGSFDSSSKVSCLDHKQGDDQVLCSHHHVCSDCGQNGHGAYECKAINCRPASQADIIARSKVHCAAAEPANDHKHTLEASSSFTDPPYHTAQADLKRKHRTKTIWHPWETYSTRYQQYRQKCRQKKQDKNNIWPDDVETAFQDALRLYLKRGRTKKELHGLHVKKQSGGNEFIADHIERMTGQERTRKQVSSHIQVLKAFLHTVAEWMFLVTPWPDGKGKVQWHKMAPRITLDVNIPPGPQYSHLILHQPQARPRLQSVGAMLEGPAEPTIRRVEFTMKLAAVDEIGQDAVPVETLHTFTSIQSEMGSAPQYLEQIPDWQILFPVLADDYKRRLMAAPIFHFSASLNLLEGIPTSHRTKNLPKKLPISLNIDYIQGGRYHDWKSINRYCDRSSGSSSFFEKPLQESGTWNNLNPSETSAPIDAKLQIPFNSHFWVELFQKIDRRREEKRREFISSGNPDVMSTEAAYTRRCISELSLMQELWAKPRSSQAEPQCMAVLLWTFSQTKAEVATTSWRRIIAPGPGFDMQIPRSLPLKSSIESDVAPQTCQVILKTDHDHYTPDSIFADNPEHLILAGSMSDRSSQESPPHADYGSYFQRSNPSPSFPSTADSTYPSNISQQGSFDSHCSGYPSIMSLENQESSYPTYHIDHGSRPLPCSIPDALFESQDNYNPPSIYPLYDHQNLEPQSLEQSSILGMGEEFADDGVRLSYSDVSDPIAGYKVPLLAPRAQMMPQHSFLQLQHFGHVDPQLDHLSDSQESERARETGNSNEQQEPQQDSHKCSQQGSSLLLDHYSLNRWPEDLYQKGTRSNLALDENIFVPNVRTGDEARFAQLLQGSHDVTDIASQSIKEKVELLEKST